MRPIVTYSVWVPGNPGPPTETRIFEASVLGEAEARFAAIEYAKSQITEHGSPPQVRETRVSQVWPPAY